VWEFANGCMRSYKILAARAKTFDADQEVQEILQANHADPDSIGKLLSGFTTANHNSLEALELDPEALAETGHRYERLDQLAMEHIMGTRG
jgi:xylose isomerase